MKSALYAKHRGKPLFDNLYDKPLRMHIELNGVVTPIDLPNPQLRSDLLSRDLYPEQVGRVPSENLINECLATLFDFILEVRSEKEKTENLLVNSQNRQFQKKSSKQLNFVPCKHRTSFWFTDFFNYLHGQFFGILNSLKVKPV